MVERAYDRTPVGDVELKALPPTRAFEAEASGPPEEARDDLFWKNFRFLKANDLKMTTPVEMELDRAAMRFFVPVADRGRDLERREDVEVLDLAERLVVSAGLRGGYTRRHAWKGERRIRAWLREHPDYRAIGPARTVYWNGPMVPPFLRRLEVHVPVERLAERGSASPPTP